VPNYDVLKYHDFSSGDVTVQVGDPATKLGFEEGWFVSGVYPPLHDGKDATIVLSGAGSRPIRGLEKLLGPSS
jgi:hypothetical protein